MSGNLRKPVLTGPSRAKHEVLFWGLTVLSLTVDLLTKYLAQTGCFRRWGIAVLSGYVENPGVTFGMLPGRRWVIIIIGCILVAGLIWFRYKNRPDLKLDIITALLIGGAAGNMYDRMRFGHVRDFIQWPVFNAADVFICAGVAYFIIEAVYTRKKDKKDGGHSGPDKAAE